MKKHIVILVLFAMAQTGNLFAQGADSTSRLAASYFHEAEKASENQKLWNAKLYGPMFFVDIPTRTVWANTPDNEGILKPDGDIYKGVLPKSIIIANTSVDWGGKTWSMIIRPLPDNKEDRLNIVLHESFHRIQARLGLSAHSPTADDLSTKDGRIYFLLELQALKSALSKPKNERKADLTSALLFREKRKLLFPETFKNEEILEANEGLAEFTGVILSFNSENTIKHLQAVIDNAEKTASLIRSAAYVTGPVYGYLLYDADKAWTSKIDSTFKFAGLVEKYYHIDITNENLDAEVTKRSAGYDGVRITAAENLKYQEHEKQVKHYVDLFTQKPVLTIKLVNMCIGFNPTNLFDLGKYGTVYPTMTVKDDWGELEVTTGDGALMKDWQIVYVPLSNDISKGDEKTIEGNGWKLNLAAGWKITADGSNYKLVKE